ncbi:MAG: hypothetical protein ACYCW6_20730, partial [Candidatus Xenobia bacterium]
MRRGLVALALALGLQAAAARAVPVLIKADPILLPGRVMYREKGGGDKWHPLDRMLSGIPGQDTVDLTAGSHYEIRVERPGFWNIQWGQADYTVSIFTNTPQSCEVHVSPDPIFNAANVTLMVILPGAGLPLLALVLLWRRSQKRRQDAEQEAQQERQARTQVAQEILAATRVALPPTLTVGKYRVLELIGDGGMASVYRVQDQTGAAFAMKIPHKDAVEDRDFTERFNREISICVTLNH